MYKKMGAEAKFHFDYAGMQVCMSADSNMYIIAFMENTPDKILSEINALLDEIRQKTELLAAKYEQYRESVEGQIVMLEPAFDDSVPQELFGTAVQEDDIPESILPDTGQETPDAGPDAVSENDMEEVSQSGSEPSDVQEIIDLDIPMFESVSAPVAVLDMMAERQAWRKDMPGTEVKDIRSAISLNDRIFFINSLFGKDAALFQMTIDRLNGFCSLGDAVEYLQDNFNGWDMQSDVVYRFMMAVRRKLR